MSDELYWWLQVAAAGMVLTLYVCSEVSNFFAKRLIDAQRERIHEQELVIAKLRAFHEIISRDDEGPVKAAP